MEVSCSATLLSKSVKGRRLKFNFGTNNYIQHMKWFCWVGSASGGHGCWLGSRTHSQRLEGGVGEKEVLGWENCICNLELTPHSHSKAQCSLPHQKHRTMASPCAPKPNVVSQGGISKDILAANPEGQMEEMSCVLGVGSHEWETCVGQGQKNLQRLEWKEVCV